MKTDRMPDLYIEQYLLGELPENIRKEMEELILKDPELNDRIIKIKQSNEEIISAYPAGSMTELIMGKMNSKKALPISENEVNVSRYQKTGTRAGLSLLESFKNTVKATRNVSLRRYTISIASALAMIAVIVFMMPGIWNSGNIQTPYGNDVRIKGLDSKLLLYRMKGKDVEELKNLDTAHAGDIIQVGYIAAGNYRYGVILSIDGRGAVTLHLPVSTLPALELVTNKRILLDKSYELDDSPSFERFIMILSSSPLNAAELMEKAKKLAIKKEDAVNGSINAGKDSIEFSIIIKKSLSGD